MERLQAWLDEQTAKRGLSWREASIKAGVNAGAISSIMNGERPGLEVCKALASFFNYPPEDVLRMAGHLPPVPNDNGNPRTEATVHKLLELWKQIEYLDPTGDSLERLTTIAVTQAEMVRAAMRNALEAEEEKEKKQGARDHNTP